MINSGCLAFSPALGNTRMAERQQATTTAQADDEMWVEPSQILDTNPSESVAIDVPPDGGYGWVCVACCFTVNAMTWGVNSVRKALWRTGYWEL